MGTSALLFIAPQCSNRKIYTVHIGVYTDITLSQQAGSFYLHIQAFTSSCAEVEVQCEHIRFLSLRFWHIVKDSSLIIPQQWQRAASPFRLSWSARAGVWFLSACPVSTQILYYFHKRLHLEYPGGEESTTSSPSTPFITSALVFLGYSEPRKTPSTTLIQRRSRDYWLVVTGLIFSLWHAVRLPLCARLWQSF